MKIKHKKKKNELKVEVYIDDTDVSTLSENQLAKIRREKIGFVFQKYNLIPICLL